MLVLSSLALIAFATEISVRASPVISTRAPTPPILLVTDSQWRALNTSVGGRLARGVPFARPCFLQAARNVGGRFDAQQCLAVQAGYKDSLYLADQFGAYQNSNWGECQATGADCLLDYNLPYNPLAAIRSCQQGSISTYYIDVSTPADVTAAFKFAKAFGVPLTVKASGHDYKGRSAAPFSLAIWTHNYRGITRNKALVPVGSTDGISHDIVTYKAGTAFLEIYRYGKANNITLVGGSSASVVAAGGWIGGGGHSALSNTLGLGVDRAIEFTVVVPDGRLLTANKFTNPDLFFALRGGGGATFGVVMSLSTLVAPQIRLQIVFCKYASTNMKDTEGLLRILIANAQKWTLEGWGGYVQPGALTSQVSGLVMFTPSLTKEEARISMLPLTNFVGSLGNIVLNNQMDEAESWLPAYNEYIFPNEELVGLGTAIASRLIPFDNFNAGVKAEQLLQAVLAGMKAVGDNVLALALDRGLAYGGAITQILITTPYNFKNPPPSAVTPRWRTAVWHLLFAPTFNYDASPATIANAWSRANSAMDLIRAITPPGAYQNEAALYEPNHEESFWGRENYEKLLVIKKKYDPFSLLSCWQCIGWKREEPKFSCYPSSP